METTEELAAEAHKMIDELKEHRQCDMCMQQAIKALLMVNDNHNGDVCSRGKSYRVYQFHNLELHKKIRDLLW